MILLSGGYKKLIEHLDFPKLRAISNSDISSGILAKNSASYSEFAVSLSNLILHTKTMSEADLAFLTMSLQNWIGRRNLSRTQLTINIGDICLADLGMVYSPELGFPHPVVILRDMGEFCFVLPVTSNPNLLSIAYHPEDNPTGNQMFRKVDKTDGFTDTCVLLLNNIRTISKGRILDSGKNAMIDILNPNSLFNEIYQKCFSIYFPDQTTLLETITKRVADLERELDAVDALNAKLLSEVDPQNSDLGVVNSK